MASLTWTAWELLDGAGPRALRLAPTLLSGMSFRWERREETDSFLGVLGGTVFELREQGEAVAFRSSGPDANAARALLRRHLRLDDGVVTCEVASWREALPRFACAAEALPGCRVLRILDPLETLITFIGSANNNIKRNMQMVRALCADFEENLIGADEQGDEHHRFPSVEQLLRLSEERLWALGWGYRAPRLHRVARQLLERGSEAFLAALPAEEAVARAALCELAGVGRKVADCVLLFGYAYDGCVPVDTHCVQIAQRDLLPHIRGKPLTPAVYSAIVAKFHELFGEERAGWAFMTLFVAELSDFRRRLDEPAAPASPPPARVVVSPHFAMLEPKLEVEPGEPASGRLRKRRPQPATPPPKEKRRCALAPPPKALEVASRSSTPTAAPRRSSGRRAASRSPYF